MIVRPDGCAVTPRRVVIDAGTLRVGPGDWEAQGVVLPSETAVAAFEKLVPATASILAHDLLEIERLLEIAQE